MEISTEPSSPPPSIKPMSLSATQSFSIKSLLSCLPKISIDVFSEQQLVVSCCNFSCQSFFLKEMKLQWKFGNSCTTRPLQCSICQNLGKVGCTDFRNCHPFDSFALFLLGKPNARLMALSISSYLCPKLPSKKPYCQTSYRSIITNSIPNGPKDSYRVKSQRKKQIPCINTYMWKPEKWYR